MARLVLLACLFAFAVSVSAANKSLVVEHCSGFGGCSEHCGRMRRYIVDTCVNLRTDAPGSYKATCTPGGSWKIEEYLKKDCVGESVYGFNSSGICLPSSNNLPVKFVSSSMVNNQVVVKICPVLPDGESPVCDAETCKVKNLSTSANCEGIAGTYYYYTAKVTGTDDNTSTLTLALYDGVQFCRKAEAPVFYKENMRKDECATCKQALRGTCNNNNNGKTRVTRTKSMKLPPTTSNITETTINETTSSHAVSLTTALTTALLSVLAVVVALY